MSNEILIAAQRQLRQRLLDSPDAIRWRPGRDLAAHLLLRLEAPGDCLRFAAAWVREAFDADRVDSGFGRPEDAWFRPQAEARRGDRDVPSVIGITMDTCDWGLRALWHSAGVVVLRDVELERQLDYSTRTEFRRMGTRLKMAVPIRDSAGPLALMCVDWMDARDAAGDERRSHFEEVATVVLGPVLSTSLRMAGNGPDAMQATNDSIPELLEALTPAERIVTRLAVGGLSYKEIARQLGRSFSTIDHQLRSARSKLGVSSTARLVNLISDRSAH